jgi:hypothetical protein
MYNNLSAQHPQVYVVSCTSHQRCLLKTGEAKETKEVPEKKFVDKAGGLQPAHRNKVAF